MDKIRLAIVGCGGMGHRHLYGLGELHRQGLSKFDLTAACDPNRSNAESLADEAESLFETRPEVVTDLDQLEQIGVDAARDDMHPRRIGAVAPGDLIADIVGDGDHPVAPRHHRVIPALERRPGVIGAMESGHEFYYCHQLTRRRLPDEKNF